MKKYIELSKFEDYKFECEVRFDKIEKHLGLNTEVSVSVNELTELPEITKVQVDCSGLTKDQIQELADIVLENKFKIWDYQLPLKDNLEKHHIWFRIADDGEFAVFSFPNEKSKTISYQEFKLLYKKNKEPLSIREVQVKVTSQEEANECAEIAKACGEDVKDFYMKYVDENCCAFRIDVEDNKFGVWVDDLDYFKTISIQEYRERFGNSDISKTETTEIDWSKAGQLVVNKSGYVWRTTGRIFSNFSVPAFEGVFIKGNVKNIKSETSSLMCSEFKLCTEPITLKNE